MSSSSLAQPELTSLVSPFQDRNFVLLWLGQLISSMGDAALIIAAPIAIYHYTSNNSHLDKIALSYWALASALPVVLLGLFAGVFVDRWDRRRTMLVSDIARSGIVMFLLRIHSVQDLWIFYVVAFVASAFSCFFSPARTALMAAIIPRQKLMRANAISTSGMQIVAFAGPALTALLLVYVKVGGIFIFDALTFAASAICIAFVSRLDAVSVNKMRLFQGVWREAMEGLQYVRRNQTATAIFVLLTIVVLGAGIYNTLEVAFAKDIWGVTDRQFAGLMAAFGLGVISAGILVAGPLHSIRPARLIAVAFGLMGFASVAFAFAETYLLGGVALFLLGLGNMLVNIPMLTLFQSFVTNDMLGRVSSTSALLQRAAMFAAAGLAAFLSTWIGWRPLFAGLSAVYLICAVLTLPLLEAKKTRLAEL